MTTTPVLGMTDLASGQSIPETTVNEHDRILEWFAAGAAIEDRDLTAPPGSPADGQGYLIAASATGAWSGKDGQLALYVGASWLYFTAKEGMRVWVKDENKKSTYDGSAWVDEAPGVPSQYIWGLFFTTTPTASEVLALHVAGAAFTIPANFTAALESSVGTNPTASFDLDVQNNGATIGTITVSTGGVVSATTVSGTSKSIAVGDVLKVVAPSSADATAADMAFTIIGVR